MAAERKSLYNKEKLAFARERQRACPREPFIHESVKIPEYVKLGERVTIYENCVIGSEGFSFVVDEDGPPVHIPHTGKLIIGDDVDIYPLTTINRGTVHDTVIGNGTKIDHHCHIGHNSTIGRNCIIAAGTVISGSVVIGDNVLIGVNTSIRSKVHIGNGVIIGMGSVVTKSFPDNVLIAGVPAKVVRKLEKKEDYHW